MGLAPLLFRPTFSHTGSLAPGYGFPSAAKLQSSQAPSTNVLPSIVRCFSLQNPVPQSPGLGAATLFTPSILCWSPRMYTREGQEVFLPLGAFLEMTLTFGTSADFPRNPTRSKYKYTSCLQSRNSAFLSRLNTLSFELHSSSMHFEISFALYSAKRFQFFSTGIDMKQKGTCEPWGLQK